MSYKILVIYQKNAEAVKLYESLTEKLPFYMFTLVHTEQRAFIKVKENPDILLLDLEICNVHGIDFIERLRNKTNIPILIMTGTSVTDSVLTVHALSLSKVDFIRKQVIQPVYIQQIADKVKWMIQSMPMQRANKKHRQSFIEKDHHQKLEDGMIQTTGNTKHRIVIIGTSTGGPRALHQLFLDLPNDFKIPIVIVQHMPGGFTKSLANRLNQITSISVTEAKDGDLIQEGCAYIAPGGYHLRIRRNKMGFQLVLDNEKDHYLHCPSVDVLFESVAILQHIQKTAIILTGMGKDGCQGVEKLKKFDKDTIVIVESPETAIIDGMPNAVIEAGFATNIIRLNEIGNFLGKIERNEG